MKKISVIVLAIVLVCAICCSCGGGRQRINTQNNQPQATQSGSDMTTDSATEPEVQEPTAAKAAVGELSDYVGTAKEKNVSPNPDYVNVFRLPLIKLDSSDAANVNEEIMTGYSKYIDDYDPKSSYVNELDYEAYLNGVVLSVIIKDKFDGGNTSGRCYSFDVTTGELLDNETLCALSGHDYNAAIEALTTNLTAEYDERYSDLTGNEKMRGLTLDPENIAASVMYLDGSGKLMALVHVRAAVGGSQWDISYSAE